MSCRREYTDHSIYERFRGIGLRAVVVLTCLIAGVTHAANPDGDLRIEVASAYNFVVDSNVESPSTYAPRSAYLSATYHNDGANPLTDVWAYIGDYTNAPGVYAARTHPGLVGTFSLTHVGGSLGAADASRYLGTIAPGESVTVYWLVTYPNLDDDGNSVTGGIKPDDDLYLFYDIWGTALDGVTPLEADEHRRVTMRNEISAAANKIFPNGANKVPQAYQDLLEIYQPSWTNAYDDGTPGTIITTEGIWYDLGNVGDGFDNNNDLVPDRNAWLQPVGDPTLFDPSCFRLVHTYALVIVKLTDGTERIYNVEDQLYFENIPDNNRGAVGYVRYDFLALRGGCSSQLTPYQEVASGRDNEKFNGDFGAVLGDSLSSGSSQVELDKTADVAITGAGSNITYTVAFTNSGAVSVGRPDLYLPLVVQDSIPTGTVYFAGSATNNNVLPAGVTNYTVYYSTNAGASWATSEPTPATNVTDVQWWLSDPFATGTAGVVTFAVTVDNPPPPLVYNVAGLSLGDTIPFLEDDATTLVEGTNLLSGTVFEDIGSGTNGVYGNSSQDGTEPGISNVLVSLYYDINGDGNYDDGDVLYASQDSATNGFYEFTNIPYGDFVIVVAELDPDVPAGFTLTTAGTLAVTMSGTDSTGNDFGFAPGLGLTKTGPALVEKGDQAVYSIVVTNLTPDTAPAPDVVYTNWASIHDVARDANNGWLDPTNALFSPDAAVASRLTGNTPDAVAVTGFGPDRGGTVTNVQLIVRAYRGAASDARDSFSIYLWTNNATAGDLIQSYTGPSVPTVASNFVFDVTTNFSSLAWPEITNATVQLEAAKSGGPGATTFNADAVGLIVSFAGPVGILETVPLQDYYDTNILQFVSATPAVTTNDFAGPSPHTGRLYWDNVGPLPRGTGTTISVTFDVIGPAGNAGTITTNYALITNATYTGGIPANEAFDEAETEIPGSGAIGDTIFWDANTNGTEDLSESGIPGVTVELYLDADSNGVFSAGDWLVTNAVTDADGFYFFDQLDPDRYVVSVVTTNGPLVGVTQSADPDGDGVAFAATNNQHGVTIGAGQTYTGADFGYVPPGIIGDLLWVDTNTNGVQDAGESGIAFVPVVLYSNGTAIATNYTDIEGYYYFSNLPDGTYQVRAITTDTNFPAGLAQVYDRDGTLDNTASNVVISGGAITSVGGASVTNADLTIDFGYRYAGNNSLSGTIGFDALPYDGVLNGTNTSGVATNESAYEDVTVYVYLWDDADTNGTVEAGEYTLIASTTTSTNGDYSFTGLPNGDGNDLYIVSSVAPDDYLQLTTTNGSITGVGVVETTDAEGNTVSAYLTVDVAADITGMDFAYRSVLAYDYGDLPDSYTTLLTQGARHEVEATTNLYLGVLVDVEDNGQPTVGADGDTLDDGVFAVSSIWQDGTNGAILEVQVGAGSGYLVGFIDFSTNSTFDDASELVIDQAVSDTGGPASNGLYTFAIDVPPGSFSTTNVTLLYGRFRLFPEEPFLSPLAYQGTTDNGEVEDYLWVLGSVGNYVWQDTDGNGAPDGGEPPLTNVTVFIDINDDGIRQPGEPTAVTDSSGLYGIGGFSTGTFHVVVDTNTLPADLIQSYDLDGTGTQHTATFDMTNGQVRVNADFGYEPAPIGSPSYLLDKAISSPAGRPAVIGETVTYVVSVTNTGDQGLNPVLVTDTYDTNYLAFVTSSVPYDVFNPGSITWSNLGLLAVGTITNVTVDFLALASTPPPDTTNWVTSTVSDTNDVVLGGQTTNAPVEIRDPSYVLDKVLTSPSGRDAVVGETVTYIVSVTNSGDQGLNPVLITDTYETNYLSFVTSSVPYDAFSPGSITWSNLGPLAIGAVTNITLDFTALAVTRPNETTNTAISAVWNTNNVPLTPQTNDAPVEIYEPLVGLDKTLVSPSGRPAVTGEVVTFNIAVTNSGDEVLDTVLVTDTYQTGELSFVTSSIPYDAFIAGSITWSNVGPLAVGGATNITVDFITLIAGAATNVSIVIATDTNGIGLPPETNDAPVDVFDPSYVLEKVLTSPSGRDAVVGETVTYIVSVTNTGDQGLDPVAITDTYDSGILSFVTSSVPYDAFVAGSITWSNLGELAVGAVTNISIDFTALVSTRPGETTNTAVSTVSNTNGVPLPPQTNDAPVEIYDPSVGLNKTLTSPSGRPAVTGEVVTFNIAVTNSGNEVLDPVLVTDTYITSQLSFVTSSVPYDAFVPGSITWSNVGPLAVGAVTNITVDFTTLVAGAATNVSVVTATDTNGIGLPPQTNDAPVDVFDPSYILTKDLTSPTGRDAVVGETVTYIISVTNSGDQGLNPVLITDTYETNYLSFVTSSVPYDAFIAGSITWSNVGPLAVGAVTNITIDFTALAVTRPNDTTNTAVSTVSNTNGVPLTPQTNDAPVEIYEPLVGLDKTLVSPSGRPAVTGEVVTFNIAVTNAGNEVLDPVLVTDTYQTSELSFVTSSVPYDAFIAGSITWSNVGPLAVGGATNITVDFITLIAGSATNVSTVTATDTNGIGLPPLTNDAPVEVFDPSYILTKDLTSPTGRDAIVGETVTYIISVTNTGDQGLDPVQITDTYETNYLSFVTSSVPYDAFSPGSITWSNLGPLAIGAVTNITLDFTALAVTRPNETTNTAISAVWNTNNVPLTPQTNDAPVEIYEPLVGLDKTLVSPSGRPAVTGEVVTFNIAVTNSGDEVLDTVLVTDTYITSELSFVTSSIPYDAFIAGSITWSNVGPLAVGGATNITVDFTALVAGAATNVSVVTATDTNGVGLPPLTNDAPVDVFDPSYILTKDLTSPTGRDAIVGETVTYIISVTNTGDQGLDPVQITDTYETNYLSFVTSSVPYDAFIAGSITWSNLGELAIGAVTNITLDFTALAVTRPNETTNTAISAVWNTNNVPLTPQTNDAPVEIYDPSVGLDKTLVSPSGRPAVTGEVVTFNIAVTNSGNEVLDPVLVTDTYITSELSFVTSSVPYDAFIAGSITWSNVGPLAVGAVTNITVDFTALVSGSATNVSTVTATDTNGIGLPPLTNDAPVDVFDPSYILTKDLTSPTGRDAIVGETVTYIVSVTNSGDQGLDPVLITDTYETNYLSFVTSSVPYDAFIAGSITWSNLGELAVGAVTNITLDFTALAVTRPNETTNTVISTVSNTNGVPLTPQTNDAPVEIYEPLVGIEKTLLSPSGRPAVTGEVVTFNIAVTNAGNEVLDPVLVTDTYVTSELEFVTSSVPYDAFVAGSITWSNVGPLAVGAVTNITVDFTALVAGAATNVSIVTATDTNGIGLPPETNDAPVTVRDPSYVLDKVRVGPASVGVGSTVTYIVSVTNSGDQGLDPVLITDTYETNYLSFVTSSVPYDAFSPGSITWSNLGELAVGAVTNITLDFTALAATRPDETTNTVISAVWNTNNVQLLPQTNDAPVEIYAASVDLDKTLVSPSGRPAVTGEVVTFNIAVTNSGDEVLGTVLVTDTYITSELSFVTSSIPYDAFIAGSITWSNVGPLAVGAVTNIAVDFTALVAGAATNVSVVTATDTNGVGLPPLTNDAPVDVFDPSYQLSKVLTSPSGRDADAGEIVTFSLSVTNTGDQGLDPVLITDTYETNYLSFVTSSVPYDAFSPGSITWSNLGPLAVGGVTNVTIDFLTLTSTLPGETTNTAVSTVSNTNGISLPPQTNDAPVTIRRPDYILTKDVLSPSGRAAVTNEIVTFLISVENTGEVGLDPVIIDDAYDTNYLAFVTSSIPYDAFSPGSITWSNLGVLEISQTTNLTVSFVAYNDTAPGQTTNTAVSTVSTTNGVPLLPQTNDAPIEVAFYAIQKSVISPTNRPSIVGEPVVFLVAVTNAGTVTLDPVEFVDNFDTNYLSFVTSTVPYDAFSPGSITWSNIGPLAASSATNFLVTFEAVASTRPLLTTNVLSASVMVTNTTPLPPQTNSVTVPIRDPSYVLDKVLTSPTGRDALVGETVTYIISVTNTGDQGLDPVLITDAYETNYLSFVTSSVPYDAFIAGSITWSNLGELAVGSVTNITLDFTALAVTRPNETTNRVVSAVWNTNNVPLLPQTNDAPVEIYEPLVGLDKTLVSPSGRPAVTGEVVTFNIAVTNAGGEVLDPILVTDTYVTSELEFVTSSVPYDAFVAGSITWSNIGPLAVGAVTNITVDFTALTVGTATNVSTVTATDTNGIGLPPQTNDAPVTVRDPSYILTKDRTSPTGRDAVVGETVTYIVSVTNTGDQGLDPVQITDTYETNYLSFVTSSVPYDAFIAGSITWSNLGELAVGAVTNITLNFTALAVTRPDETTNTVISSVWNTNNVPLLPQTNDAPVEIYEPLVGLDKTLVSPSGRPAVTGEVVTFNIAVTNSGDEVLDTVLVTDTYVTSELEFVTSSIPYDAFIAGSITWSNVGPLAVGGATNITVDFITLIAGSATNVSTVTATDTNGIGLPPLTNDAPVEVFDPSYILTKDLTSPTGRDAIVGETVTYIISVTNTGDQGLDPVQITDTYETNYLSFVTSSVPYDAFIAGSITWSNLGELAVGSVTNIILDFTALAVTRPNETTNTVISAVWNTNNVPLLPQTNDAPVEIYEPLVGLDKTLVSPSGRPAVTGEVVTFNIAVTNAGNEVLDTVLLTDTYVTSELEFVTSSIPYDAFIAGSITWSNVGPLAVGAVTNITVDFRALVSGSATNISVVTATDTNGIGLPPLTNDAPVDVFDPSYILDKVLTSPTGRDAVVGDTVTFVVSVTNSGDQGLDPVLITDTYETNYLSFVTSSVPYDVFNPGSITWSNIGPLAIGAITNITLDFTALAVTRPDETTNTVISAVWNTNNVPLLPQTNDAPVEIYEPLVGLDKTLVSPSGRPAVTGEVVTFNIAVTNAGDEVLDTVLLTDTYVTSELEFVTSSIPYDAFIAGSITWSNVGPLAVGAVTNITVDFTALTVGTATNVSTVTATDTNGIGLPPQTNDAPVTVRDPAYILTKDLTSPTGRDAVVGDTVTFVVSVTNSGDQGLDPVQITDTYETNYLAFVTSSVPFDAFSPGSITWSNLGELAIGAVTNITLDFTALAVTRPDETTNTVISAVWNTNNVPLLPQTNDAPVEIYEPLVGLDKTLVSPSGRPAVTGEVVTFNIAVTNAGNEVLDTVLLTDTYVTSELEFVTSSVPVDAFIAGSITWSNVGPLAVGAVTNITVDFTALVSGSATNVSTVTATDTNGIGLPPLTNDAPVDVFDPSYILDKVLTSPTGRDAIVGETVTYIISVTNSGDQGLDPVLITDTYETNYLSFVTSSVPYDVFNPGSITWSNIGELAIGAVTNIILDFTALAVTRPDETTNTAVSAVWNTNNVPLTPQTNDAPVEIYEPSVGLNKTLVSPSGRPAVTGEVVTFNIAVTNSGDEVLDTVLVTDTYITSELSFVTSSVPVDAFIAGSITWSNVGPLAVGAVTNITVDFTALTVGTATNVSIVTATDTNGIGLPPLTNDAPVEVFDPSYILTKDLTSPTGRDAIVGETVTYIISVTNTGDQGLDPVQITDTYETNYLSFVTSSVPYDAFIAGSITWSNLGELAVGSVTNIILDFTALAVTRPDETTNTVISAVWNTNNVPLLPQTNDAPVEIYEPLVGLDKTLVSPSGRPAVTGEVVTFNIAVTNSGDEVLDTVLLTDTYVTSELEFVTSSIPYDAFIAGSITWSNVGPLAVGAVTNITVDFRALVSGSATNISVVTATDTNGIGLPPLTNDAPVDVFDPSYILDKVLTSPTGRDAVVGDTVTFVVSVTNSGDQGLDPVLITDTYETNYLSFVTSSVPYDVFNPGSITWSNIGPLAIGAITNITLDFTALAVTRPDETTNTVISAVWNTNNVPLLPQTNDAPVEIYEPLVGIEKTLLSPSGRPAVTGEVVTFNIAVTNAGDEVLDTVLLTDTYVTSELEFVTSSIPYDAFIAGSITWSNVGPLAVGAVTNITVDFTALVSGGATNVSTVTATDTNGIGLPPQTNDAPVTVRDPAYILTKDLTSPTGRDAVVGDTVTFVVSVTNSGDQGLDPVQITDTYETNYLAFVTSSVPFDAFSPGSITWSNLGELAIGAVTNITLDFTALAVTRPDETTNTVISAVWNTNNVPLLPQTNDAPVEIYEPLVGLDKTLVSPSGRPAVTGEVVTFNIAVTNSGDEVLGTVLVTDTYIASELEFVTSSVPFDAFIAGSITWSNVGPLAVGAVTNIAVDFTALVAGAATNVSVVTATDTNGIGLPPLTNDAPVDVFAPSYILDKVLTSPTGRPAVTGEVVTFSLSVTNTGDQGLSPVLIADTYDASVLQFVTSSVPYDAFIAGSITWSNLGELAVGSVTNVTIEFLTLSSTLPGETTNTAVSAVWNTNNVPLTPQTNDAPVVVAAPSYVLDKVLVSPSGRAAVTGEVVRFSLRVTNTGDQGLDPVLITDSYDAGVLQYATSSIPLDAFSSGSITWSNVGPLAVGAVTNITVDFLAIGSTLPGETTNIAVSAVSNTNGVPLPPQTNGAPVAVGAPSYLLNKTMMSATPVFLGAPVYFSLSVTNTGDQDLDPVMLDDTYDTNYLAFVTSSVPYDVSTPGSITWSNLGVLAVGEATNILVEFASVAVSTPDDTTNTVVSMVWNTNGVPLADQTNSAVVEIQPLASIGDRIWEDLNGDGIQDVAETNGIAGVLVTLYDATNGVVAVTNSLADGSYVFTNIVPGVYHVEINVPVGLDVSARDQGSDDSLDSDADALGVMTTTVLSSGENDMTWDAGLYYPVSLGDTVWIDTNGNGIHDEDLGEVGLNGVDVNLYRFEGGVWVLVGTTTSATVGGERGRYEFNNLPPGQYRVDVVLPTVPDAYDTVTTVLSHVITLDSGQPYWENADFGFMPPADPTAIELVFFRARWTDASVHVAWRTAMEIENAGFNVYRADSAGTGEGLPRGAIRVNAGLIPGSVTGEGRAYAVVDSAVLTGRAYYYWLEDVEVDGDRTLHGPALAVALGEDDIVLNSWTLVSPETNVSGLVFMDAGSLDAAGVDTATLDVSQLKVWLNGQETALFTAPTEGMMDGGDYAVFYIERSVSDRLDLGIGTGPDAKRMTYIYAEPVDDDGAVFVDIAGTDQAIVFTAGRDGGSRYLLTDFLPGGAWILDVSDPLASSLMFGYAVIETGGREGYYLSYMPDEQDAPCIAVGVHGVIPFEELVKPDGSAE